MGHWNTDNNLESAINEHQGRYYVQNSKERIWNILAQMERAYISAHLYPDECSMRPWFITKRMDSKSTLATNILKEPKMLLQQEYSGVSDPDKFRVPWIYYILNAKLRISIHHLIRYQAKGIYLCHNWRKAFTTGFPSDVPSRTARQFTVV
jgi:hypothetical protein